MERIFEKRLLITEGDVKSYLDLAKEKYGKEKVREIINEEIKQMLITLRMHIDDFVKRGYNKYKYNVTVALHVLGIFKSLDLISEEYLKEIHEILNDEKVVRRIVNLAKEVPFHSKMLLLLPNPGKYIKHLI